MPAMNAENNEKKREALRKFIKDHNLVVAAWCKAAKISEGTLRAFLTGKTQTITVNTAEKLAKAVGVYPAELWGEQVRERPVSISGIVGAGAEVFPNEEGDVHLGEAECPPGLRPNEVVALRVKGDSMMPVLHDGWLLYYTSRVEGGCMDYLNKLVVVKIKDGPTLVKILKKGYTPGRFGLFSANAQMIEDVELEWCAKVLFIRPV